MNLSRDMVPLNVLEIHLINKGMATASSLVMLLQNQNSFTRLNITHLSGKL
jgi:hypothetical protein